MRTRVPCPGDQAIERHLREWYQRPMGRTLGRSEQARLDEILPNLFGYHLLQVGSMGDRLFAASRILHRAVMAIGADQDTRDAALCAEPERLPIAADSLDALILYHTLEFAQDPHQVLREVERTLVPEGHVVVLGFNPRSPMGIRRLLQRRRGAVPWCGRFLSLPRLRDWLRLLGFDVVSCHRLFFLPPVQRARVLERLGFLESWGRRWWPFMGGAYVLVGRKKVSTLTPIKPRWRPRRSIVSGLADPASQNFRKSNALRRRESNGRG